MRLSHDTILQLYCCFIAIENLAPFRHS
jgi:hypothetical protein